MSTLMDKLGHEQHLRRIPLRGKPLLIGYSRWNNFCIWLVTLHPLWWIVGAILLGSAVGYLLAWWQKGILRP